MLKRHPHSPTHLFVDDTAYCITGAIYQKRPLLKQSELKELLLDKIRCYFKEYCWELHHWVILDNHYHILGRSRKGSDLTLIFKRLHGSTASYIHEATRCKKPVWWNYWDYCPRDEREYYIRMNYLLWNPVKHGYVENLKDYPFSSFHQLYEEIGREKLAEQFREYPEYRTYVLREAEEDDF